MKLKIVLQKTRSTKVRIFITNYINVHDLVDFRKEEKKIKNK